MTNQHMTSPGPARDDPVYGDPVDPSYPSATSPLAGDPSVQDGGADDSTATAKDQAQRVASEATDQAREVAGTATDQARAVASTARDEARHVAGTASDQARRLAGDARHELRAQAGAQIDRLAEGVDALSGQLRSMAQNGDRGPLTDIAGDVADRTQQLADRIRQGGVDDTLQQVRSLGRNRPAVFLLGAFGVGLVAGRVARNLAQDPSDRGGNGDSDRPAGAQPELAFTPEPATDESADAAGGEPRRPVVPTVEPQAPSVAPVGNERWGS